MTLRGSVSLITFPYRGIRRLILGRGRGSKRVFRAAELAADEGLTALSKALADPDPTVRTLALDVICEFSEERAARLLSGALHDPEPSVRMAAAAAAARLRAFSTVFSLILTLDDHNPEVRSASAEALETITSKKIDLTGTDDAGIRAQRVSELKQWWKSERFERLKAAAQVPS